MYLTIHVIVFVSLLNRMFAFMLHSEYTTGCITSKQDRHFIGLFWTVILFTSLNVNMFFSFVCLSVRLQVLRFRYFGRRFFFRTFDVSRESRVVPPTLWFSRKRIEIIFRGRCWPWKLKSAKNNPHVFETKPRKFGNPKISHYTVSGCISACLSPTILLSCVVIYFLFNIYFYKIN